MTERKEIIVEPGDTLWSLAEKHLGDGFAWRTIWALNERTIRDEQQKKDRQFLRMRGPDWIFPGTKLVIP